MYILNFLEHDYECGEDWVVLTMVHPTKTFEIKHLKEKWLKSGHKKDKEGFIAYLKEKGFIFGPVQQNVTEGELSNPIKNQGLF